MQTTPTLWSDRKAAATSSRPPVIDEPLLGLLVQRLHDLERRLIDMSDAMEQLMRERERVAASTAEASAGRARLRLKEQSGLAEVRAACARVASGRYGLCELCGSPIERKRLVERPQVQRCSVCEAHRPR